MNASITNTILELVPIIKKEDIIKQEKIGKGR